MVDQLRSGGFGGPSLSYGTRGSGFSQYRIGDDDGENLAYLDKLSAQTAWQNGQISDDAYLAALQDYVNAVDEDSSTYISAVNQLEDARWNIGRNELVVRLNRAASPQSRVRALRRLRAYDRRWRATMTPDNEQYREMTARIDDLSEQIRAARWGAVVKRYNNDRLSDQQMLAFARRMVREAGNKPDAETYRGYVRQFENSILDDQIQDAIDAWEATERPARKLAGKVEQLYRQRMDRMNPSSPAYERYAEALESFQQNVDARVDALEYERNRSAHEAGYMPDDEWLSYLHTRVRREKRGTVERIRARDAFINESFETARRSLEQAVADGERSPEALIDFYGSSLAVMDLDSSRAQSLLARIEELRATGLEALNIDQPNAADLPELGGHWVRPSGVGLADVKEGYISQHDGSQFASTNCGMAAAAMLGWDVTGGKLRVSGGELRYYSGDREKGTWTDDVVRALGVVGVKAREFHGMSLSTFRKRVASGKPALLTGTNAMLPPAMRFGYDGDHSVFVARVTEHDGQTMYWVMDPNGPGGDYKGAWWTEEQLFRFGWQGSYSGSAVFAGKSATATPTDPGELPPIQRFDTDYAGRSTLGRGGGASRAEAGPRRDWSRGKRAWKLAKKAGGPRAVADFLGAVDGIERNLTPERRGEVDDRALLASENAREDRAARILARNDNDPRRAMIEWFTAQSPSEDPGSWTKAERWYANAAARKLDLEKVKRTSTPPKGEKDADAPPAPGEVGGGEPGREVETGLTPELDGVAKGLLRNLGVEPTKENVTFMAAWVRAESGDEVEGNNPLKLRTPGNEDLAGQYGKSDDGVALFYALEHGMDAAAAQLRSEMPGLVGALRSGDPGAMAAAVAESDWSETPNYAGIIVRNYNQLPGDKPLITRGEASPYRTPPSWASIVRQNPDAAEMFSVDPLDDVQKGWFDANLERARDAAMRGESSFLYYPPGAATPDEAVPVPISAAAAKDLLRLDLDYGIETLPPTPDRPAEIQKRLEDYAAMSSEIDLEAFRRYYDTMREDHDIAILRGDLTTAYNIELDIARATNAALGIGPNEDPSIEKANRELEPEDEAFLMDVIDAMQPTSVDPARPGEYAPSGSVLMAMERDGDLHVEYTSLTNVAGAANPVAPGYAAAVNADPGAMYSTLRPDGRLEVYWQGQYPDMFEEVKQFDLVTGEDVLVPRYQSYDASKLMPITTRYGTTYQPVEEWTDPLIDFYIVDYTGRDAELEAMRQSAPNIVGPARAYSDDIMRALGTSEEDFPIPSAQPNDENGILRKLQVGHTPDAPGHPTVYRVEMYDTETRDRVTWMSIDRQSWIGWMGDKFGETGPGLVAMNGATWRTPEGSNVPELVVNGQPYDEASMGPIGQYLGWYGAPGTPGNTDDGLGARNADYMYRQAEIVDGPNGPTVSLTFEPTPIERAQAGTISYNEAAQRTLAMMEPGVDRLNEPDSAETGLEFLTRALGEAHAPAPTTPSLAANRRLEAIGSFPGGNQSGAQVTVAEAEAEVEATRAAAAAESERAAAVAAARQAEADAERNAAVAAYQARKSTPAPKTTTTTPKATEPPAPVPYKAPVPKSTPKPKSKPKPSPPPTSTGMGPNKGQLPIPQDKSSDNTPGPLLGGGR